LRLKAACAACTILAAALLAGCAAPPAPRPPAGAAPPPALTAPYAAAARAGETVYALDASASQVVVLVDKAGPLAAFGHRHAIAAGGLRGFALLRGDGSGRANLLFPVKALEVDPPALRRSLGGDYAEPLDKEAREGTRKHMLGQSVLDATRYPWIALAVSAASGDNPRSVEVRVTLHGETRALSTPARLARQGANLAVAGSFTVRQTEFGIKPYSAALGGLRVKDALEIRYHLLFRRWCGEGDNDGSTAC